MSLAGEACVCRAWPSPRFRPPPLPISSTLAGADKSAFGFKMLQKMGWSEGKGLGRKEDGMTTHIRMKRRPDAVGVGAGLDAAGNVSLLGAVQDYNRLLADLRSSGEFRGTACGHGGARSLCWASCPHRHHSCLHAALPHCSSPFHRRAASTSAASTDGGSAAGDRSPVVSPRGRGSGGGGRGGRAARDSSSDSASSGSTSGNESDAAEAGAGAGRRDDAAPAPIRVMKRIP